MYTAKTRELTKAGKRLYQGNKEFNNALHPYLFSPPPPFLKGLRIGFKLYLLIWVA